jgi:hypothetical protein
MRRTVTCDYAGQHSTVWELDEYIITAVGVSPETFLLLLLQRFWRPFCGDFTSDDKPQCLHGPEQASEQQDEEHDGCHAKVAADASDVNARAGRENRKHSHPAASARKRKQYCLAVVEGGDHANQEGLGESE